MDNNRSSTIRLAVAISGLLAVSLISLFALRRAFSASPMAPTPTIELAAAIPEPTNTDQPTTTSEPTEKPTTLPTLPATNTTKPRITDTPEIEAAIKPSRTPTRIPRPTQTPIPSPSPTSLPQLIPLHPTFVITGAINPAAVTAIPTAVPTFQVPGGTTNVVLIGTDAGGSNMDTIIIVGINRDSKTVSMLSIPRDTYVYITPLNKMARINTARNPEQLKQTIL